jgi:hypothetical protein
VQKKAFTLIEVALTIFLVGLMGALGYSYISTSSLLRSQYKTTLESQVNLIESMVFQCKSLSNQMPMQVGGVAALDTNLSLLECNTSVPYAFDGGRNGFVPIPPTGFSPYHATESGSVFYISISADNNSTQDAALKKLAVNYTLTQATLDHNATSATFKFYLSR